MFRVSGKKEQIFLITYLIFKLLYVLYCALLELPWDSVYLRATTAYKKEYILPRKIQLQQCNNES